jgi:transposase
VTLRPTSLDNFGPSGWWAIAETLVDGDASATPSALADAVRGRAMDGDLRRADAWLADGGDDLDRGAQLLTEQMINNLADAGIVERGDGTVRLTDDYLRAHRLPDGGVRMVWDGGATYDALPADAREARQEADRDRENASAAVQHASKYRRDVKTPDEREGKFKKSREAAEELFKSVRAFGYLEAFPVTINATGRVIEGNHRLKFAELARRSLVEEREQVAGNGSDPLLLADLDRRIASLARDRIMDLAVHPDGRAADDVKVVVASQIQIPWLPHERKQLAQRLYLEGYDVASIAQTLDASERSVQEWTQEDRESTRVEREVAQNAEIQRLAGLGWSQRRIAERLGLGQKTVSERLNRVSGERGPAETTQRPRPPANPKTPAITDTQLAAEATDWIAQPDARTGTFIGHIRSKYGSIGQARANDAIKAAKAARERAQLTGTPQPAPAPTPPTEPTPPPRICDKCGGTGQLPNTDHS